MISLGYDVGTLVTKTVVLDDGRVLATDIRPNEGQPRLAVEAARRDVLAQQGLRAEDVEACGATGWGAGYVPAPRSVQGIIGCLARGADWVQPGTRTVVDIGGLSTTIISVDPGGRVVEYRTSDRCAAGTGFFLEMAAQALELTVEEFDAVCRLAKRRAHMSAQCAVFAESEIITHVNEGVEAAEIVAGILHSVASGVATMVRRLGLREEVLVTGGVAKIPAAVEMLEQSLGLEIRPAQVDPQLVGAIGAALAAREEGR